MATVLIPLRIRSISTSLLSILNAKIFCCLNPFENQVYFYNGRNQFEQWEQLHVLIPLRIRSISTAVAYRYIVAVEDPGLNPFENQVYFYKG